MSATKSKSFPQVVAALSAAGGALAAGTMLGWTSPTEAEITGDGWDFSVSKGDFTWISSVPTIGAALVCIPIGILIKMIGRKLTMLLLVLPFTIGWALLIWPPSVEMMILGRFLLGLAGGAFCVTSPIYTGEIAHKDIRGTLGNFFQLMITIGILYVYAFGNFLSAFGTSVACGIIPLVFGVIFAFMPETPTYLVSKGKKEDAIKSIKWLRGDQFDYAEEMQELQANETKIQENPVSVGAALTRRVTLRALRISLGLMLFQQLSGINAVIFFTTQIFDAANTGINPGTQTIAVGTMQVIATFVSVMIVDRVGRRILLLLSSSVMALCTILLGVYFYMLRDDEKSVEGIGWLPMFSLCLFIIMFSIGFGPVPWMMMGELFPSDIKSIAGSIAGTSNWLLAFFVVKFFDPVRESIGAAETFWVFSAITIVGFFFVWFIVPETKGKSLNEIQAMLEDSN